MLDKKKGDAEQEQAKKKQFFLGWEWKNMKTKNKLCSQ